MKTQKVKIHIDKPRFTGQFIRLFSSKINKEKINQIANDIENHPTLTHPFFDYLKEQAKIGFTAKQMQIQRDNYFMGCFETIPSLSKLLIASCREQDKKTLTSLGINLFEETGEGKLKANHTILAEKSFNIHCNKLFSLSKLKLKEAAKSELITPETRLFVSELRQIFASNNYFLMLGSGFADEFASNLMMKTYYETLFLPYKGQYNKNEYQKIADYWIRHLNGTEERHAEDLKNDIANSCKTVKSIDKIKEGVKRTLEGQYVLFNGILREMEKAEKVGFIIPVDILKEQDNFKEKSFQNLIINNQNEKALLKRTI